MVTLVPAERRRALVIEDDPDARELLRELLDRGRFDVSEAGDGSSGLRQLYACRPNVVLLDISLPGMTGWDVLERIRELSDVPVLIVSAHGRELERVRGLNAGADDYVTKPIGRAELVARIEAVLRRHRALDDDAYSDAAVQISFSRRLVRVAGNSVQLTPLEFRLLAAFVRHPNQILSSDQLVELAWENDVLSTEAKLYVSYLRRKLRTAGAASLIETVRGFGYRYRVPV
jgi:DNA-binding response OmpR family regulator